MYIFIYLSINFDSKKPNGTGHLCLKWPPQYVIFHDTKFFFWKPWNKKLTTSGLYQCSPSLCACKEVMACCGDGLHVKWISVCHGPHNEKRQTVMALWSPSALVIHHQEMKNSYYSPCEAGCRSFQCWESFLSVGRI